MKIIKLLVISILICSQSLWAKNIVLLSSLPKEQIRTTNKIKTIFHKKLFGLHDHNLIYINNADQYSLHRYLNDPETMALFWISHGGFIKINHRSGQAIGSSAILYDYNKDNVSKVFQRIHPNIKFISIVGCNSSQILDGIIQSRSDLSSYIPAKKVVATWALRKAIRRFKKNYKREKYNFLEQEVTDLGIKIKIERVAKQNSKSLKVFAGNIFIGILPSLAKSESQVFEYYIPYNNDINKQNLKIILSSGQSAYDSTDNFGDIHISSSNRYMWKIFAKPSGEPFGVNERIFLFKDEIQNITDIEDYILYQAY